MKHLYLVRHGIAVDGADSHGPDGSRPLTGKGRKRFGKAARGFARHAGKVDLILTSPLVRAVQTAEILAEHVGHREVAVLEELDPRFGAMALLEAVGQRAGKARSIALVGHEPQLSAVLAALAHLSAARAAQLDFKKGAIVRLDMGPPSTAKAEPRADPRWWLKPRGTREKGLPLKKAKGSGAAAKPARRAKRARRVKPAAPAAPAVP